ncbi:GTP-binding protein REM 1 isoform X2 [Crotalus tigris]|uniref:GTP-binding protein REM 1 isoform X2 n=1 Tax=Crotalus tigris TaxID=88082 RepID=UPI00192F1670|nr:GTP-binding protein REM 1 isoform X2 [Crotalus tigris]
MSFHPCLLALPFRGFGEEVDPSLPPPSFQCRNPHLGTDSLRQKKMTLNIQRGSPGGPCQRRASTPVPASHRERLSPRSRGAEPCHPQLGQSLSCEPRACLPEPCGSWRSESPSSEESSGSLYRVVFLGDPGVGKSSLVSLFAGVQEKDSLEQQREDTYERTLSVDGEETTLVAIDPWEAEKRVGGNGLTQRSSPGVPFSGSLHLSRPENVCKVLFPDWRAKFIRVVVSRRYYITKAVKLSNTLFSSYFPPRQPCEVGWAERERETPCLKRVKIEKL